MLTMRDVLPSDKDQILVWRNSIEVAKYMISDHVITPNEHERWFSRLPTDTRSRYWIIQYEGEDLGLASINEIDQHNKRCSWAFYLSKLDQRKKGIGSLVEYFIIDYVFEEMKFNKLCGEVLHTNELVLRMHKGFGFVQEGRLRRHVFKGGEWFDIIAISLLREEWLAGRGAVRDRLKSKGVLT